LKRKESVTSNFAERGATGHRGEVGKKRVLGGEGCFPRPGDIPDGEGAYAPPRRNRKDSKMGRGAPAGFVYVILKKLGKGKQFRPREKKVPP